MAMNTTSTLYSPAQLSRRLPSPPRINVPPPPIDHRADPTVTISYIDPPPQSSPDATVKTNATVSWVYTQRRDAQEIVPRVYLGPTVSLRDTAFLREEGINFTINFHAPNDLATRQHAGLSARLAALNPSIAAIAIPVGSHQELISLFSVSNQQIRSHLAASPDNKVLLHCESGSTISAAAVAAYMMTSFYDVDHIRAMQLIQGRRFCANFDEPAKRMLEGYWDLVAARRDLNLPSEQSAQAIGGASKRSRPIDEDHEMSDVTADGDAERFAGRTFMPFVDRMQSG